MTDPPISSFTGVYRFLSNFYRVDVFYDGMTYPSVENAYQAAKSLLREERKAFTTMTAGEAKRAGRSVTLRPRWEEDKLKIMHALLRLKFFGHPDLAGALLLTGERELIEGNNWRDTWWGVCNGVGQNNLGKLLMLVRKELHQKTTCGV